MTRKYIKGDVVKIWSLQSFQHGGYINGKEGLVSQDQDKIGDSVLVSVVRRLDGEDNLDPYYEVYSQQLELVVPADKSLIDRFNMLIQQSKKDY